MDKNMIIINKNNLSARLFASNGYFYIIFLYFYPLIFYTKEGQSMWIILYHSWVIMCSSLCDDHKRSKRITDSTDATDLFFHGF